MEVVNLKGKSVFSYIIAENGSKVYYLNQFKIMNGQIILHKEEAFKLVLIDENNDKSSGVTPESLLSLLIDHFYTNQDKQEIVTKLNECLFKLEEK